MRWSGVRCAEGAALTLQQAGPHWALTPPLGRRPAAQKPGERSCRPENHMPEPKVSSRLFLSAPRKAACMHAISNPGCGLGEGSCCYHRADYVQ